jgi:hypothetical protein
MARKHVYHFTDTARLPWILKAGVLLPGQLAKEGWVVIDFLWATTSAQGEDTAASACGWYLTRAHYWDCTREVRITLAAEDFEPWGLEIFKRHPLWQPAFDEPETLEHIERLKRQCGLAATKKWRVRIDPLPLSRVIRIDIRLGLDRWKRFDMTTGVHLVANGGLCVDIDGALYGSTRQQSAQGIWRYKVIYLHGFYQRFAETAARFAGAE